VAEQGRKWAIEHYAPKPTAERFLKEMGFAHSNVECGGRA